MTQAIFLFFLLICSCSKAPKETIFRDRAMMMPFCIKIGKTLNKKEKIQVKNIIEATFHEVDSIYNNWNPESEISQLNALKKGEHRVLSNELQKFFFAISRIYELSDKKYDPCVGNLILAYRHTSPIPMQRTWRDIIWEQHFFVKSHTDLIMDFCGASKGYGVDLLIERLSKKGFQNLYVEWAGEIRAIGKHPEDRHWTIQIRPSQHMIEPVLIELNNAAIATSGPTPLKSNYAHIIDPTTGKPISFQDMVIASVSVKAPTCLMADALATAAMTFTDYMKAKKWAEKIVEENPEISIWIYSK